MRHRRSLVALIALALLAPGLRLEAATGRTTLRVFAVQYRLDPADVVAYDSFYHRIRVLTAPLKPRLAGDRPNLIVFGEDAGLHTLATGPRFAHTRDLQDGGPIPDSPWGTTEPEGIPAGAAAAFASLLPGYAVPFAYYRTLYPHISPSRALLLAATDTMARSFYNAFARLTAELAFDCSCRVYVVAGNNMAPFEEVPFGRDPGALALVDPEILLNGDPVLGHGPITYPIQPVEWAYRATAPEVYNTAFVWGPQGEIARVRKVNLTPLEGPTLLDLSHGPISGVQPVTLPGTDVTLGIAISLDAFAYGSVDGDPCRTQEVPLTADPLAQRIVAPSYMRCLDARGATVMIQPEANPKRWASYDGAARWEPLTFMGSDWRAVSDPDVSFRYAVSAFTVGNLIDLPFDGQSGIWERGRTGPGLARIGAAQTIPGDSATTGAGPKPEAVTLAPWVVADGPDTYTSGRADLMEVSARLAPGSGDPLENAYIETILCADLDTSPAGSATPC